MWANTFWSGICEEAKNSTQSENMDFTYALQSLINQEGTIEGLPPGGGIYAKWVTNDYIIKM